MPPHTPPQWRFTSGHQGFIGSTMSMADLPFPMLVPLVIAGVFAVLALLELWRPVAPASRHRWIGNVGLGVGNALMLRLLVMIGPIAAAQWGAAQGFGLFTWLGLSGWPAIILGIIALDCAIYWQHRAMHHWRWGWAMHRLHHADEAMDVSTGVRFHPAEALVSLLYKGAVAIAVGVPIAAILAFELWVAIFSLFEHSNLALPGPFDRWLRKFWVTPAMHRIHHSAHGQDHNHNYGFAIGLWDHLFGTYRAEATGPKIGLPIAAPAG